MALFALVSKPTVAVKRASLLRKVPDEDPFPCGGREKLRDEKFKWKPGDAFEFIGGLGDKVPPQHDRSPEHTHGHRQSPTQEAAEAPWRFGTRA